jgi:hypothetical protein
VAKSRRAPEDEDVRRRRADDDEDDAPRRKRRRDEDDEARDEPFKPRKKRKSAAGPTKKVIRIIAAVVGAVGLIIFLYWVYSPIGTDSSMLCYFPKETTYIQGYDYDEALKNAKLQPVHQAITSNYRLFGERRWTGIQEPKETDVSRYLHGQASGDPEEEKDLPPQQRRGELTVVRFKIPVDEAKFIAGFPNSNGFQCEEMQAKDGRKFYQLWWKKRVPPDNHEEREDDISFFFPNSKTLVYGTTRRELTEAMTRTPGRVVLEGTMKELSGEVDGEYFTASTGSSFEVNGASNSMAFGLGFVDDEFRDQRRFNGVVGTASWFASNGNDFLYASANLYGDKKTAREVRRKLDASYTKAQEQIYQSESGKPSGLTDPFSPAQPKGQGAGGGQAFGGGSSEQTADIIAALAEYSRTARVRLRGRLVIIEGTIPHGTPEQGIFEKFWSAVGSKFTMNQFGGGGFGGMGGMPGGMGPGPGMGGGMPGGMPAPGGVPIGPGR